MCVCVCVCVCFFFFVFFFFFFLFFFFFFFFVFCMFFGFFLFFVFFCSFYVSITFPHANLHYFWNICARLWKYPTKAVRVDVTNYELSVIVQTSYLENYMYKKAHSILVILTLLSLMKKWIKLDKDWWSYRAQTLIVEGMTDSWICWK